MYEGMVPGLCLSQVKLYLGFPIRHDRGENRKGGNEAAPIFGREMKVGGNMVTPNAVLYREGMYSKKRVDKTRMQH